MDGADGWETGVVRTFGGVVSGQGGHGGHPATADMVLVLQWATSAADFGGADVRGDILCSQTAQCASSPVCSPADGRHVCGARGYVCAGNE